MNELSIFNTVTIISSNQISEENISSWVRKFLNKKRQFEAHKLPDKSYVGIRLSLSSYPLKCFC